MFAFVRTRFVQQSKMWCMFASRSTAVPLAPPAQSLPHPLRRLPRSQLFPHLKFECCCSALDSKAHSVDHCFSASDLLATSVNQTCMCCRTTPCDQCQRWCGQQCMARACRCLTEPASSRATCRIPSVLLVRKLPRARRP